LKYRDMAFTRVGKWEVVYGFQSNP